MLPGPVFITQKVDKWGGKWQQVVQIEACSNFYRTAQDFLGFLAKKFNITIPSILLP